MKYLVLGVKKFDFDNKETGEVVKGMNITAVDIAHNENEADKKGILPIKLKSPDTSLFQKFNVLPGIYDIEFSMKPDAKGNPVIVLTGAVLTDDVTFTTVPVAKKAS